MIRSLSLSPAAPADEIINKNLIVTSINYISSVYSDAASACRRVHDCRVVSRLNKNKLEKCSTALALDALNIQGFLLLLFTVTPGAFMVPSYSVHELVLASVSTKRQLQTSRTRKQSFRAGSRWSYWTVQVSLYATNYAVLNGETRLALLSRRNIADGQVDSLFMMSFSPRRVRERAAYHFR